MRAAKESNFVSACLYTRNCANNITGVINELNNVLFENFNKYEIICVDDDSSDGTVSIIKDLKLEKKCNMLTLVTMSSFHGLEKSMQAAVDVSIGDFVMEFDSIEFVNCPDMIMKAYTACIESSDIVLVSPTKKKFFSKIFYKVFNVFSFDHNLITTEIFRVVSRRAINRINQLTDNVVYRKTAYANCGLGEKKLTVALNKRAKGYIKNKNSNKSVMFDALFTYTKFAYTVALWLAVIMAAFSLFMSFYAVINFLNGSVIEGWTTTMLFISVGFAVIFILFAVTIKYLSIILRQIINKKEYKTNCIEKIINE